MIVTFSNNVNGEQVFARCRHKEHKTVLTYLVKIIKELDVKRPNMVLKKEEGYYVLKFCSLSKKDLESIKSQLLQRVIKYSGEKIEFEFE